MGNAWEGERGSWIKGGRESGEQLEKASSAREAKGIAMAAMLTTTGSLVVGGEAEKGADGEGRKR